MGVVAVGRDIGLGGRKRIDYALFRGVGTASWVFWEVFRVEDNNGKGLTSISLDRVRVDWPRDRVFCDELVKDDQRENQSTQGGLTRSLSMMCFFFRCIEVSVSAVFSHLPRVRGLGCGCFFLRSK